MFGIFKKKKAKDGKPSREELIAQAQANMRAARQEIGEENIDRLAQLLSEDGRTPGSRAREQIRKADKGHVADNIKIMLGEKD